jgi:hypothetical protein
LKKPDIENAFTGFTISGGNVVLNSPASANEQYILV